MVGTVKVGEFTISVDGAQVAGPAQYLDSMQYREVRRKIETGTYVLIPAFPPGTSLGTMIGVMLQTDYAAWLGQRELLGKLWQGGVA